MSVPTRYVASLELAVHDHGKPMADFWRDPLWQLDGVDREQYTSEYAWFAKEFDNPDYATGAVLSYSRVMPAEGSEFPELELAEFAAEFGCPGESIADLAKRSQEQGLDGPSCMDWNIGGITYVVDTTLSLDALEDS